VEKLLFLTSRFPFPLEKGDKLRAYFFIKTLSKYFDIYLFAVNEIEPKQAWIEELSPYCKAIETSIVSKPDSILSMIKYSFNRKIPFQVAYFYNESSNKKLQEFVKVHQPNYVFCHLIRMSEYCKNLNISNSMLDYMDTFSIGMQRMEKSSPFYMKFPIIEEAKRLTTYENLIFNKFKHKIIISNQDKNWIPHPDKNQITVVPNGVDNSYFTPTPTTKKFDLLFVGNMSYPPNIKAATYASKVIMPELIKLKHDSKLIIAGAQTHGSVESLACNHTQILGWQDDVRTVFNEARIMIAPMLISIGLQNKILQAMSMHIPCVISTFANNALGAKPEEEILIADDPKEYTTQILRLLNDNDLYYRITKNAALFVKENFNWDRNTEKVKSLFDKS
jgi:glycosyltransferase involved in cell wall biosynthesis